MNKANKLTLSGYGVNGVEFDFNDSGLSDGMYKLAGNFTAAQHCPPSLYGDATLIHCGYAQIVLQQNDIMWFRSSNWNRTVWNKWSKTGTATKPEEHILPLAEGWTAGRKTKFSVSQDSLVLVTFGVWGPAVTADRMVIAQLPPGFRPAELISKECIVVDDEVIRYTAGLDVDPNGSVIVYANHIGWTSAVGQVAFYTGD